MAVVLGGACISSWCNGIWAGADNCWLISCRTAAPPAPANFVADAPAELDGSLSTPNSKNMSPLSPDSSGLPARIPAEFGQLSYSKQYDHLFAKMPLDVKKPVPKPNPVAQQVRISLTWGC